MGRIKMAIDLSEAKKYTCDKITAENLLQRPEQVEKGNLDPLSS